eukprot:TRINITY_DN26580_c0_g1_i1.p1 TRINITY_DN26580_c0_g1~~TRINITY_DN26580_c0_g1_i1.p1  ORF type:complete len:154 (+),score=56.08 TRINITY_DN26580_c0_g1_i1:39-500(+)
MSVDSFEGALFQAAKSGYADDAGDLIKNKRVAPNHKDSQGNTPLHYAAAGGHLEVVKILLAAPGIKVNEPNGVGDLPIHKAAWKGFAEVINALVAGGADLSGKNKEGKTAHDVAKNPQIAALCYPRSNTQYNFDSDEEEKDEDNNGSDDEPSD